MEHINIRIETDPSLKENEVVIRTNLKKEDMDRIVHSVRQCIERLEVSAGKIAKIIKKGSDVL